MNLTLLFAAALALAATVSAQVSRFGKCIPEKGATAQFTKFRGKTAEQVCQRLLGDCAALKHDKAHKTVSSCNKIKDTIVEAKCITTTNSGTRLSHVRVLAKQQNLREVYDFKPAAVGKSCYQFEPGFCSTKFYNADEPEKLCKVASKAEPVPAATGASADEKECSGKQRALSYFKAPDGRSQVDVCRSWFEKCSAMGNGKDKLMRVACAFTQLQPRLFEAGCVQAYDGKKTTYARIIAKNMSLELAFQPKDGKCANHLTQGWCTKADYDSQPYELCTPGK